MIFLRQILFLKRGKWLQIFIQQINFYTNLNCFFATWSREMASAAIPFIHPETTLHFHRPASQDMRILGKWKSCKRTDSGTIFITFVSFGLPSKIFGEDAGAVYIGVIRVITARFLISITGQCLHLIIMAIRKRHWRNAGKPLKGTRGNIPDRETNKQLFINH